MVMSRVSWFVDRESCPESPAWALYRYDPRSTIHDPRSTIHDPRSTIHDSHIDSAFPKFDGELRVVDVLDGVPAEREGAFDVFLNVVDEERLGRLAPREALAVGEKLRLRLAGAGLERNSKGVEIL